MMFFTRIFLLGIYVWLYSFRHGSVLVFSVILKNVMEEFFLFDQHIEALLIEFLTV